MTYSPARAHKAAIAAEQAAKSKTEAKQHSSEYELMLANMDQQRRSLKTVQSVETKKAMKAEFLKEWQSYIDTTLAENSGAHDPIIARLWVWSLDVGDLSAGIALGRYLLDHELPPPEGFVRDTATTFAEEIAEVWLKKTADITASQLQEVLEITAPYDTLDEVRAKLHRAVGEAFADTDSEKALTHLNRALELNPKVGCKKQCDALAKKLTENNDKDGNE